MLSLLFFSPIQIRGPSPLACWTTSLCFSPLITESVVCQLLLATCPSFLGLVLPSPWQSCPASVCPCLPLPCLFGQSLLLLAVCSSCVCSSTLSSWSPPAVCFSHLGNLSLSLSSAPALLFLVPVQIKGFSPFLRRLPSPVHLAVHIFVLCPSLAAAGRLVCSYCLSLLQLDECYRLFVNPVCFPAFSFSTAFSFSFLVEPKFL